MRIRALMGSTAGFAAVVLAALPSSAGSHADATKLCLDVGHAHWLSNGREIEIGAFKDDGPLAVIRSSDGSLARMQPLAGIPTWADVARAPDGSLAWMDLDGRLAIREPGRKIRLLPESIVGTSATGEYREVADGGVDWSPDGRSLAFTVTEGEGTDAVISDVRIVHRSGRPVRRLADSGLHPVWAPDGKRIAFHDGGGVTIVDVRASAKRRIVRGYADRPDWSPRGDLIAFDDLDGIYVVRPDGSGRRHVAGPGAPGAEAAAARWSPDSRQIAYSTTDSAGCFAIGLVHPDGTGRRLLIPNRR